MTNHVTHPVAYLSQWLHVLSFFPSQFEKSNLQAATCIFSILPTGVTRLIPTRKFMMPTKRAAATALTRTEDSQRSVSQWMKLDVASLRLKCNTYYITPSGKKPELAAALFNFFENERIAEETRADDTSPVTSDNDSHHGETTERGSNPPSDDEDDGIDPDADYYEMRALNASNDEDEDLFSEGEIPPSPAQGRRSPPLHDIAAVPTIPDGGGIANNNEVPENPIHNGTQQPDDQSLATDFITEPTHTRENVNNDLDQNRDHNGGIVTTDPVLQLVQNLNTELKAVRNEVTQVKSQNISLQKELSSRRPPSSPKRGHKRSSAGSQQKTPAPPAQKPPKRSRRDGPHKSSSSRSRDKPPTRDHDPRRVKSKQSTTQKIDALRHSGSVSDTHFQQQMRLAVQQSTLLHQQQQQQQQQQLQLQHQTTNSCATPSLANVANATPAMSVPVANSALPAQPGTNISPQDPWAHFRNPFTPPALTETVLKKIEDGKFVDFTDLLPENQALDIISGTDGPHIVVDESSSILTFKDNKLKKAKVNSFHRWSTAWCAFAQAHLHYHPQDYFALFKYHSLIVRYVNEYKYAAVFKYDRDFRLTLQSEKNSLVQTCSWEYENDHLRNKYLLNNPLPICDHCETPGHMKHQCRAKNTNTNNNNNNNNSSTGFHSQDHTSAPPQPLFSYGQQQQFQSNRQGQSQQSSSFRGSQQNRSRQQRSNNNNNNHNNNRRGVPPSQKYCFRYGRGEICIPPCMFLHACENCGDPAHGAYQCQTITSSNFIPIG